MAITQPAVAFEIERVTSGNPNALGQGFADQVKDGSN
jgi:hypothetical protein